MGVGLFELVPSETLWPMLAVVAALAVANLLFFVLQSRVSRWDRFLVCQIVVDLVILTAALHFSGGIENPFSRVYIFHIVIAAVLLPPRIVFAVTALASVLLAGLSLAEAWGTLAHYPIALFPYPEGPLPTVYPAHYMPFVLGKIAACTLVFWVVAFFCAYLGAQLRLRETALRGTADAVRASEQRLQAVVDSMGAALLLWSSDLRLTWSNRTAREWFRIEKESDGAGRSCRPACMVMSGVGSECAVEAALEQGFPAVLERPHRHPDGTTRTLRIQAIPLRDEKGDVTQILEMAHDVTERKAMEAQVLESAKTAFLGRMAGAVAHEIGNPLSSMAVRLRLLEEQGDPGPARETAAFLQEQVARIRRLVVSITRFSRPSAMEAVACDVGEILHQVVGMLQMDPRARDVEIETQWPAPVPPVFAIRDQLVQVFLNLGLNAVEAMPGGGKLAVSIVPADGQLSVAFADTGCGLSDDVEANLFRPFFTTKANGTGLGLFISYKMACDMGGVLRAENRPGGGSRFELVLPVSPAAPSSVPLPREERLSAELWDTPRGVVPPLRRAPAPRDPAAGSAPRAGTGGRPNVRGDSGEEPG